VGTGHGEGVWTYSCWASRNERRIYNPMNRIIKDIEKQLRCRVGLLAGSDIVKLESDL
jgi:hypothetical protein